MASLVNCLKILINESYTIKKLAVIGKSYLQYANDNPEVFIFMFSQTLSNKDRINNYQEFHQLFLTAINESFNLDDLRKSRDILNGDFILNDESAIYIESILNYLSDDNSLSGNR